jgi:hypothetical protein
MSTTFYSQLPEGSIRLLQLLPNDKESNDIECELLQYPLEKSERPSHPYEALSYVWGSEDKPKSIVVTNQNLNVTCNLHRALLQLRDHACPRLLWIDAICINQDDKREKEHQIPLIAEIYAKAVRVIVWLGDAEDDSNEVLEHIRLAVEASEKVSHTKQSIIRPLQRPCFQRIWVGQSNY